MVVTRNQAKARDSASKKNENGAIGGGERSNEEITSTIERSRGGGGESKITFVEGGDAEESKHSERRSRAILVALLVITIVLHPRCSWFVAPQNRDRNNNDRPTLHTVFYYGWISAVSTGLGVLPLCFVTKMKEYWIGVSNAIAAGMMCAASYSLFAEGCTFDDVDDSSDISATVRTGLGGILGLLFILGTKHFLEGHEDVKLGTLSGADTRRIILIVFVMTLHSFSEGVGIGVSFGGERGHELGMFISASLAVHNVPEGLAVAIVLLPRKVSKATAALWCVATSLPQPLMAVPAFMFVHSFLPLLPVGLGFAGGAMMWVAFVELLMEAYEDTDAVTTGVVSTAALGLMILLQRSIEGDDHA
ncbi:hypothetical protein ACHAXA_010036 [Cyclostephanos tholiformis]|uniref:Uncharacterized protein n=1 Tax=Cyclostephanos tholiformis TaxID=382380 RepID=A0ABD3RGB1_9STRA